MSDDDVDALIAHLVPVGSASFREGMKRRIVYDHRHLAPPTHDYWYGTLGRRWAGRGRKAPGRNWKYASRRRHQYQVEPPAEQSGLAGSPELA